MKSVYIMRHAKSGPAHSGLDDFDRPLSAAGGDDARLLGRFMADNDMIADCALVSPALRTRQTWDLVSDQTGVSAVARSQQSFYLAPDRIWLSALNDLPSDVTRALVIGHHPGVDTLAVSLTGRGNPKASASMAGGFPPCGLAELEFDCTWTAVQAGAGRLIRFITPRLLED